MGMFSWFAQNDDEQICSDDGHKRPVVMIDNKGNRWCETDYEGYGVFGGKDFYALAAEMNGIADPAMGDDENRMLGIDMNKPTAVAVWPNLIHGDADTPWEWIDEEPESDPNQGWFMDDDDDDDDECGFCGR